MTAASPDGATSPSASGVPSTPLELTAAALLTDLDGVLADSSGAVLGAWHWWAERVGADPGPVLAAAQGVRASDTIERFAPDAVLDLDAEVVAMERRELDDADRTAPIPGAADLVAGVPSEVWAVVTSGSRAIATARLTAVGIEPPEVMITAEDVTAGKPAPDAYLTAARALGVSIGDCVVVEDSPAGIAAGCAAGATVVAVATSHPADDLDAAHHVVDDPRGLIVRCGRPDDSESPVAGG